MKRIMVVLKSTTIMVKNYDAEALGCCGMATTILVQTTTIVNSPRQSLKGYCYSEKGVIILP